MSEFGLGSEAIRKICWPILLNVTALEEEERTRLGLEPYLGSLHHSNEWKCKWHIDALSLPHQSTFRSTPTADKSKWT